MNMLALLLLNQLDRHVRMMTETINDSLRAPMLSWLPFKKNGLPYDVITCHEGLAQEIFNYFEKSRFVRKKVRHARKAVKSAIQFARKKQTYPSKKTDDALNALGHILDEIEYTHKAILTAFEEAENIVKMIKQEKIGAVMPLIEKARAQFKDHDIEGGMDLLNQAQNRLKNKYLTESRKAILAGIDSDIKKLKYELIERKLAVQK
jgi:hypothetical protein